MNDKNILSLFFFFFSSSSTSFLLLFFFCFFFFSSSPSFSLPSCCHLPYLSPLPLSLLSPPAPIPFAVHQSLYISLAMHVECSSFSNSIICELRVGKRWRHAVGCRSHHHDLNHNSLEDVVGVEREN